MSIETKLRNLLLLFFLTLALPTGAYSQMRVFAKIDPNANAMTGSAEIYNPATGGFDTISGSLITPRSAHTATPLSDGTVLLVGGYNGRYLSAAETYTAETGEFASTASAMKSARSGHAAVSLQNGQVLIAGGFNGFFLDTAEIYDPTERNFSNTGTLTAGRAFHTGTLLSDGKVLIAGGFDGTYLATALTYNPEDKTFITAGSSMAFNRSRHTATLLSDGKVLIAGGFNGDTLDTSEIYDPAGNSFSTNSNKMTTARQSHTATVLLDGKVLIAGGLGSNGYLQTAELFDPGAGTFTATAGAMSEARSGHSATLLPDGKVLITGGYNGSYLGSAEVFDPAARTFTQLTAPMSILRQNHTATLLPGGSVLIAGGQSESLLTADVNIDPTDNVAPSIAFSPDSTRGFISYTGSGVVVAFSAQSGEILQRINTGGKPTFITPLNDGQTLAVVSVLDNRIFFIDMGSFAVVKTYVFSNAYFGFGSVLAISPDGSQGYISSTGTADVIRFSMADGAEQGRLKDLQAPAQVTVSRDGATLMVVDTNLEEVVFADTSSMTKKYTLKARDHQPLADFTIFNKAVLSPDGASGIIASRDIGGTFSSGTAFVFQTATGELLHAQAVGSEPGFTGLTPNGQNWVIRNDSSLSLIPTYDPAAAQQLTTVGAAPLGSANIVFSPDSRYAAYAASNSDLVLQQDLLNFGVVSQVLVGDNPNAGFDQPSSMAITPDGKVYAVFDFISSSIELMADATTLHGTKFLSSGNQFTGVSLVNLSDATTTFTLYLLNNFGEVIRQEGLDNPTELNIGPNGQISQDITQIFNLDFAAEHVGWLAIFASQPRVAGYLSQGEIRPLWLSFYLNRMDGAPLFRERIYDWVIPEIENPGVASVELNFVNPNYNQGTYGLTWYAKDGSVLQAQESNPAFLTNRQPQIFGDVFTILQPGLVLLSGGQGASSTLNSVDGYDIEARTFFAGTSTLSAARKFHTATLLLNTKVLIAGGSDGSASLNTAETFDRTNSTYTVTSGAMAEARQRHTATLLPSGRVLIAGGQGQGGALNSAEIYEPGADSFSAAPDLMVSARDGHTATLLRNGKVLLAGGSSGNASTTSAELFDPATGQFTPTGNMTAARQFHTATLLPDGKVLISGGTSGSALSSAELYDPATGVFTATANGMGAARSSHSATLLLDGTVLIAGGTSGSGALDSAETYSPSSGRFIFNAARMTTARRNHTATLQSNGIVLLAGGSNGTSSLDSAETFDPSKGTFDATAGAMTAAREGHAATLLSVGGEGYLRIKAPQGMIFTEFVTGARLSTIVNGINVAPFAGVHRIYSPQFAMVPGFKTILNLVNANPDADSELILTLHAADGKVIGTPAVRAIPRNGQLKDDISNIFPDDPAIHNTTGWLEIESSADYVLGTIAFTNDDRSFHTSLALSGTPLRRFVFPLAAEDASFQTAIALLNANDASAQVTLELWGPEGNLDRSASLTLAPGSRVAQYLNDYFPGLQSRLVGNIRIRSTEPLHSFSLVNDRSLNFIAAVPAVPYPEE